MGALSKLLIQQGIETRVYKELEEQVIVLRNGQLISGRASQMMMCKWPMCNEKDQENANPNAEIAHLRMVIIINQ